MALNRHWYDALLDYSPTTLIIDSEYPPIENSGVDEFVQSLKKVNLNKLKHFKFRNKLTDVILHKERFDVLFFKEKYYDNSEFVHFLVGNPHFSVYISENSPFSTKKVIRVC